MAAFMQAAGIDQAHVSGLSLGAATGIWLAAKYPERVKSLSLHSGWPATDPYLKTAVEGWQIMAQGLASVPEMVIKGIFPWCFTPELYAARPEYIDGLADFVRGRPVAPMTRSCASRTPSSAMTPPRSCGRSRRRRRSPSAGTTR